MDGPYSHLNETQEMGNFFFRKHLALHHYELSKDNQREGKNTYNNDLHVS